MIRNTQDSFSVHTLEYVTDTHRNLTLSKHPFIKKSIKCKWQYYFSEINEPQYNVFLNFLVATIKV